MRMCTCAHTDYSTFLIGLYVSFNKSSVTVAEGNSTIIQIVLDHGAGSNFSVDIAVNPSSMITGNSPLLLRTKVVAVITILFR